MTLEKRNHLLPILQKPSLFLTHKKIVTKRFYKAHNLGLMRNTIQLQSIMVMKMMNSEELAMSVERSSDIILIYDFTRGLIKRGKSMNVNLQVAATNFILLEIGKTMREDTTIRGKHSNHLIIV